jgi:hypothetical protein
MPQVPDADPDVVLRASRDVLINAVNALSEHSDGVTVVGAHAVYLRSSSLELTVAPATSDADLVLNPSLVEHPPEISSLMIEADYTLPDEHQPGLWSCEVELDGYEFAVGVDLLVPAAVAGSGRRAAQIPPHDKRTARRVPGLEAALLDRDRMDIVSYIDPSRRASAWVAGPAALLVAKGYKVGERLAAQDKRPDRVVDKDAADVARIMMANDPDEVRDRRDRLEATGEYTEAITRGWEYLDDLFAKPDGEGLAMAVRNLESTDLAIADIVLAWMDEFRRG